MRTDILERKEEIVGWIGENNSKAFICKQLKCKPETLNSYLVKMNIEYSGNKSGKGKPSGQKLSALELSKKDWVGSHKLRIRMLEDDIKEHRCEHCNNTMWNGNPIPLELHHVNGDRFDNRFENLEIVCPNCHAQTSNHAGRNINANVAQRLTRQV